MPDLTRPSRRQNRNPRWIPGSLAIILPLIVYFATMARGLVWGDGVELTAVSYSLGIAHPTGYPLFTILAHPFCRLFTTPAFGATFFCALLMALACGLLFRLLAELGERAGGVSKELAAWLALCGALGFSWAQAPWSHATRVEVYGLQLLFLLALCSASVGFERAPSSSGRHYIVLLFALGLGHHLLATVAAPWLVRVLLVRGPGEPAPLKRWMKAAPFAVLGLMPMLYLPIRAATSPVLNFGDPADLAQWLWVVKGGDFVSEFAIVGNGEGGRQQAASTLGHLGGRLGELAGFLARQLVPSSGELGIGPIVLAVAAILVALGAHQWWRHYPANAAAWLTSLSLYLAVLLTYDISDIVDYQLGFLALLWPLGWLGLISTASRSREGLTRRSAFLLLVLPLALLIANWGANDRSGERIPDLYASRLRSALPHGALLVTEGDVATATAWYLKVTMPQEQSLEVVCLNLLHHPWYQRQLTERGLWHVNSLLRGEEPVELLQSAVLPASTAWTSVFSLVTRRSLRHLERAVAISPHRELLTEDERVRILVAGDELPPYNLGRLDGARGVRR